MLSSKFESLLHGSSFASVPFMSQMKSIREEYEQLKAEGFATSEEQTTKVSIRFILDCFKNEMDGPVSHVFFFTTKSKRYAISAKEEREAEEVIHREALERTRMSEANQSFAASAATGHSDFDNDDFDSPDDGFDDAFTSTMNETMEIQPSFYDDNNITFNEDFGFTETKGLAPFNEKTSTVRLLDIICNADAINNGDRYEYFDSAILENMTGGNTWAGSAHWKKGEKIFRKKNKNKNETKSEKSKKESSNNVSYVDFFSSEVSDNQIELISEPAKAKRGTSDPLQLSKTTISKLQKEDNLLPHDAEIDINHLFRLFLRPNSAVVSEKESTKNSGKKVGK